MKKKRIRRNPDTTRALILDMAEKMMVEESYAAVSTRRVAQHVGINAATVHYYYPTTDDMFIALHQRMMDRHLAELEAVLGELEPVEALWRYQSNWDRSALGVEFLALASHRKAVGKVISEVTSKARENQVRVFERAFAQAGISSDVVSPVAMAIVSIAIARTLANEERVGITTGHDDVRKFVRWALDSLAAKAHSS